MRTLQAHPEQGSWISARLDRRYTCSNKRPPDVRQQVASSKIVSLINQGQVKSALITDKNQTIQITTKNGKQLEASWVSSQGLQLKNALQAQVDKGNLPGGYNVTSPQSHALLDVLTPAVAFLAIVLLLFWGIDYRNRGRGLLTSG